MIYTRRFLQFNDLVFDEYDMLSDWDDSEVTFKQSTENRSYGHGSYVAFKRSSLYVEEQNVSMVLRLNMKKLPCEEREHYKRFAIEQLSKPGKLWAIDNNNLIWAFAFCSNYSEIKSSSADTVELDISFVVYEGVWHKANKQKTFLLPYDICRFMDCYNYEDYNPCEESRSRDCCNCPPKRTDEYVPLAHGCCCDCDIIEDDMALCYHLDELQNFYGKGCSGAGYKLVYDCNKADKFFKNVGKTYYTKDSCSGGVAVRFGSDTDIPTDGVTITLKGKMHNPYVEINGNGNWIEGDYDGKLTIYPNGDVYYGDCCEKLLDPSVWKVPQGMDYGFEVLSRDNRLIVQLGSCCGGASVTLDVDALTI